VFVQLEALIMDTNVKLVLLIVFIAHLKKIVLLVILTKLISQFQTTVYVLMVSLILAINALLVILPVLIVVMLKPAHHV